MSEYGAFLARKAQVNTGSGFDPLWMPEFLFDFQKALVEWAIRQGRAAIFADCGLGKTPMQLVWAENVVRQTSGRVLILTPLAVSHQTVIEAGKFGIEAHRSHAGDLHPGINVTNYERLHYFNPADFAGAVCDESSILKSFDGKRKQEVTEFMRRLPYRLLATATAAPNDYVELGTSSEALGGLGHMDMLNRFFKNDQNTSDTRRHWARQGGRDGVKWRFKGHAEVPFWRWVCSWARALRRPSDLGFDDRTFLLPPLIEREQTLTAATLPQGRLFAMPAVGLYEQREERRRTITERCEKVASLVSEKQGEPSLVWCHLNAEGDLLETLMPYAIQARGSDSDEWKERAAEWFAGNRCLCSDKTFSAKLPAWLSLSSDRTHDTCAYITKRTRRNGSAAESSGTRSTGRGGAGIEQIASGENSTRPTSDSGRKNTPRNDSHSACVSTGSAPRTTDEFSRSRAADAESVDPRNPAIDAGCDSTLTIAIKPDARAGSSVQTAILGSGSSKMIPIGSLAPRCICGHSSGKRVLISKPVMFGYGLNLEACSHVTFFPSHSFEQYYQGIRRCWRFGQTRPVVVDLVMTEGERAVMANLQRKAAAADRMFSALVAEMNSAMEIRRGHDYPLAEEMPSWL